MRARRLKLILAAGLGLVCIIAPMDASRGANSFAKDLTRPVATPASTHHDGEPNVHAYGAVDTLTSASCTSASSTALSGCGSNTFINGEYVAVLNGGPVNSLGPPTGALTVTPLTAPNGSTGSTVDCYCVTTVDANMGESACSSTFQTTSAASTLGSNQFNNVTWNIVSGAAWYKVYFCTGANCTPNQFRGWVYGAAQPATDCPSGDSCLGYVDYGFANPSGAAPPALATNDTVFTRIAGGGGTASLMLAAATSVDGSVTVVPDDATPAMLAMTALAAATPNASTPAGGRLRWPRGYYSLPRPVIVPSQVWIEGDPGSTQFGANSAAAPDVNYGTALVYSGQTDGLPSVIIWDGVEQALFNLSIDDRCFGGLNTNLRDTACSSGFQTQSMTGVYLDSDATTPGGTDKSTVSHVFVAGAHHAFQIGGTLGGSACNGPPAADVSGTSFDTPEALTYNIHDQNGAEGLIIESGNAGFASRFFDTVCLGMISTCIDIMNNGSWGEIVSPNCGLSRTVTTRTCVKNSSGAGGFLTGEIDDSLHNSSSYSYWQPATAQGAAQTASTSLIANQFNNRVQLDGGSNVVSIGNTAGGNKPTWTVNFPSISVFTTGDANNTYPCPWTYQTAATGYIVGCDLNPGGESLGGGHLSLPEFPGLSIGPGNTSQLRAFLLNNYGNPSELAVLPESNANSGIPADHAYTLLDIILPSREVFLGTAREPLAGLNIYGPSFLYGSTSGTAKLEVPAAAGTPAITLPNTNGSAGQPLESDAGAGTGYTWGNPPFSVSAGVNTFGASAIFTTGSQIAGGTASTACHFTNLSCANAFHGSTCATPPTVQVFQTSTSHAGTALLCPSTLSTIGSPGSQAETLPIPSGDTYGIYISVAGGTCATDEFMVSADIACP